MLPLPGEARKNVWFYTAVKIISAPKCHNSSILCQQFAQNSRLASLTKVLEHDYCGGRSTFDLRCIDGLALIMVHIFIVMFFGSALAVGLYCLWVALRLEVNRAPKSMRFDHHSALHPAIANTSAHPAPHGR